MNQKNIPTYRAGEIIELPREYQQYYSFAYCSTNGHRVFFILKQFQFPRYCIKKEITHENGIQNFNIYMDKSNVPTYIFTLRDKSMRPNATLIKDGAKSFINDDTLFAIDLDLFQNLFFNNLQESKNIQLVKNEKFDYPAKHNPESINIEHVQKSPNIAQVFQPLQQPFDLNEELKLNFRDIRKTNEERIIKERGWNKSSPKFNKAYLTQRRKELERNFNSSGSLHLSDLESRLSARKRLDSILNDISPIREATAMPIENDKLSPSQLIPSQLSPIISNSSRAYPSPLNDIEHLLSPPSSNNQRRTNIEPLNNFMEQRTRQIRPEAFTTHFITPNRELRLNKKNKQGKK